MSKTNLLTLLILLGLIGGVLLGQFALFDPQYQYDNNYWSGHWTKLAGDLILIRPLTLMVIPLVLVSVVVGVTKIGDPSRLGVVGGSTVVYYISTMLISVTIGTALVTTIEPGVGVGNAAEVKLAGEEQFATNLIMRDRVEAAEQTTLGDAWLNILKQMIPTNIVREMSATRPLGVIVFALLLGLALAAGGEKTALAIRVFDQLFDALMRLVQWIIWLTPPGVFLLAAWTVGKIGLGDLVGPLAKYMSTVLIGLAIHAFIVLPLVLVIFTRRNPLRFMWQMRRALMTAFGTDSSSATLPVTIESAETEGGCSKKAANFVLPLGATVNMDGTALYEAVAVVFLFQLYGIDLSFAELLIVVITATLAAVGAAGIPSAGLVTMVIVITAVNTSVGGRNIEALPLAAIGVIIGVDRILDMCRTTVNVWGDAIGAKIITRIAPDDEPT